MAEANQQLAVVDNEENPLSVDTSEIDIKLQGPALADLDAMSGVDRAAVLLLSLGKEFGEPIWNELDDDEITQLSTTMSRLGSVPVQTIQELFSRFISQMSLSGALMGSYESTEKLLAQFLPPERLLAIMEEIRGPAGRNMWEKLTNVEPATLANYLKNEYPQTVAVILSKINPNHAASVLGVMPDDFALEVVQRMLAMEPVQRDILEKIEETLRAEFISNLSRTRQGDAHELMAQIFNNFDRQTETRFLTLLEEADREASARIKSLMFTFEDLAKLDAASAQILLRNIEKDSLVLALKGASDNLRDFFFGNMSERAGKMLREDLEVMGPVRLKEVDDAQASIVAAAKSLEDRGEIILAKNGAEDELVY